MKEQSYKFYKIPKVVFCNPRLSPCAKLVFTYLSYRESYYVNIKGYNQGAFIHCYLRTLANQIGKSTDSVRKNYIPELIAEGYVEKRNRSINHSTQCEYRIKWETITNGED